MRKSDLKPGMTVRNIISKNVAEVLGSKDGDLYGAEEWALVRLRMGKHKKWYRTFWAIQNLEIVRR